MITAIKNTTNVSTSVDIDFITKIKARFVEMCKTSKLFRVDMTGQQVWDLYLSSFAADPKFRDPERSEHNCNNCNNFIRRYGNIVAIDENYKIMTMFEVDATEEFIPVVAALTKAIKSSKIDQVFFETFDSLNTLPYEKCNKTMPLFQLGMDKNIKQYTAEEAAKFGVVKPDQIISFAHLHLFLPDMFVDKTGKSVESIMGNFRSDKDVFQRAMETISLDTLQLVKDLIAQGSLLDGPPHLYKLEQIIPLKQEYDTLSADQRNSWCWTKSYKLPFAKFRNELIGVLCTELSEGKEINEAAQAWNKRVDPVNYMKTSAPITKKQIEDVKKFVEQNGYTESFDRRLATMDDIKVSEILHSNIGKDEIKTFSIFDGVKTTVASRHKRNEFDGVEEIHIDKFMKDVLPSCTSIEVFLKNTHEGNLLSMTTTNDKDSKPIFKWSNNYSWTFNGNLAGKSQIKEAVKSQGGKVDGVLRFSIMWAEDSIDNSDLDAHCKEPDGTLIYYGSRISHKTQGNLDIDITQPQSHKMGGKDVVENIAYPNLSHMTNGVYTFLVNQYNSRQSKGFKAEIEFNGELYYYEYTKPVSGNVLVAEVTLKNGEFTIVHRLPATDGFGVNKEIYGLETNQFHKVNLMCLSPNHWGENNIGNKHYFFMLEGCKSPTSIRSFHSENLIPELAEHRKVLEVLGTTTMVSSTDKQLSGVGFNATVRDELIVKLSGSHKRTVKIKF